VADHAAAHGTDDGLLRDEEINPTALTCEKRCAL
jgi:hypothetical protein